MHTFRSLFANLCLFMILSSCATCNASADTETAKPVNDVCPRRNDGNSLFQVSLTGNSSLNQLRLEIEDHLNSGGTASGLQPLIVDIQNNTIGSINGILSSRLVVEPVETHQRVPRRECTRLTPAVSR